MTKKVLLLGLIMSALSGLFANLTKKEEKAILAACEISSVIKLSKSSVEKVSLRNLKKKLDVFFKDSDVRSLFVDRIRNKKYAFNIMRDLKRKGSKYLTLDQKRDVVLSSIGGQRVWEYVYESLWKKVAEKYKLVSKASINGSSGAFVLKFKNSQYLLKIPAADWYDGEKEYYKESTKKYLDKSKYQNVSRVFYNRKLRKIIKDEGLESIYTPKKYLYHIPRRPCDVCDDNYIVVVEECVKLPAVVSNCEQFKKIATLKKLKDGSTEPLIHSDYVEMITQLVQAIQVAGLWDIKDHNVFILPGKKIVITDTQKPGLGGGFDCNFFHKDTGGIDKKTGEWRDGEFQKNGYCGIGTLEKLLS